MVALAEKVVPLPRQDGKKKKVLEDPQIDSWFPSYWERNNEIHKRG